MRWIFLDGHAAASFARNKGGDGVNAGLAGSGGEGAAYSGARAGEGVMSACAGRAGPDAARTTAGGGAGTASRPARTAASGAAEARGLTAPEGCSGCCSAASSGTCCVVSLEICSSRAWMRPVKCDHRLSLSRARRTARLATARAMIAKTRPKRNIRASTGVPYLWANAAYPSVVSRKQLDTAFDVALAFGPARADPSLRSGQALKVGATLSSFLRDTTLAPNALFHCINKSWIFNNIPGFSL